MKSSKYLFIRTMPFLLGYYTLFGRKIQWAAALWSLPIFLGRRKSSWPTCSTECRPPETHSSRRSCARSTMTPRGRGTIVYDRGGDRPAFYKAFIENGWDFIVQISFGAARSSTRNPNLQRTSCSTCCPNSGNCSQQTFAENGTRRMANRETPQILRSGSESHTARSPFLRRKTPIPLMKTHLPLYSSG